MLQIWIYASIQGSVQFKAQSFQKIVAVSNKDANLEPGYRRTGQRLELGDDVEFDYMPDHPPVRKGSRMLQALLSQRETSLTKGARPYSPKLVPLGQVKRSPEPGRGARASKAGSPVKASRTGSPSSRPTSPENRQARRSSPASSTKRPRLGPGEASGPSSPSQMADQDPAGINRPTSPLHKRPFLFQFSDKLPEDILNELYSSLGQVRTSFT